MKVMPQSERTANGFTCMLVNFMMDRPLLRMDCHVS